MNNGSTCTGCTSRGRRLQLGQSLVEVCVACIALVPLAIGLVYVGQYIHIKQAVQQAARQAAWDAATSPATYAGSAPALSGEETRLRSGFFANASAAIESDPETPASFADAMLPDYSGKVLLAPGQLTLSTYSDAGDPGPIGTVEGVISGLSKLLSALPFTSGSVFPPDAKGYVTARVDARTTKATYFNPLDTLNLDFHSQTVLLADAWNADGGGETDGPDRSDRNIDGAPLAQRTVLESVPPSAANLNGSFGSGLTSIFNFVGSLPVINVFFPMKGLNFGRAAPDVIPYDKLQPYQQ